MSELGHGRLLVGPVVETAMYSRADDLLVVPRSDANNKNSVKVLRKHFANTSETAAVMLGDYKDLFQLAEQFSPKQGRWS